MTKMNLKGASPLRSGWLTIVLICGSFTLTSLSSESYSEPAAVAENTTEMASAASNALSSPDGFPFSWEETPDAGSRSGSRIPFLPGTSGSGATSVMGLMALKSVVGSECLSPTITAPAKTMVVNGNKLSAVQAKNIQWFAHCVFPFLPAESRDQQAEIAAGTSWWGLREGNLSIPSARIFRYSNCNVARVRYKTVISKGKTVRKRYLDPGRDVLYSNQALFNCPMSKTTMPIWQVGIAAGQVTNHQMDEYQEMLEKIFSSLSPAIRENDVLAWTATLAGFGPGTSEYKGILNSEGRLRRSWLMRNPLIETMLTHQVSIRQQCLKMRNGKTSPDKFCINGSYPDAKKFSGSVPRMKRSISDLKRIYLQGLSG